MSDGNLNCSTCHFCTTVNNRGKACDFNVKLFPNGGPLNCNRYKQKLKRPPYKSGVRR